MKKHRSLNVFSGPLLFLLVLLILAPVIEFKQAAAIATIFWMGLWWVLRPVNIAVTSLLPIPLNAIFGMVPMEGIISKYFSEIVVLLVGSDLISLVWEKTHLDKRLAIKSLCGLGTSPSFDAQPTLLSFIAHQRNFGLRQTHGEKHRNPARGQRNFWLLFLPWKSNIINACHKVAISI